MGDFNRLRPLKGAAVTKLGAQLEGVLRQDRVTWTGRVRDTCIFSVLKDEWSAVRDGLDQRLAAFPHLGRGAERGGDRAVRVVEGASPSTAPGLAPSTA